MARHLLAVRDSRVLVHRDAGACQQQFYSWLHDGRPNAFWLTGFFNAQEFITVMHEEVTRAHKGWALDSAVCTNDVTKMNSKEDCSEGPKEGVYIWGLFLDGAGRNKRDNQLAEQQLKVLFVQLPVVHVYAINSTSGRYQRQYECPIYKKPRRTDQEYICMVDLRSKPDPIHWTLCGVQLLL